MVNGGGRAKEWGWEIGGDLGMYPFPYKGMYPFPYKGIYPFPYKGMYPFPYKGWYPCPYNNTYPCPNLTPYTGCGKTPYIGCGNTHGMGCGKTPYIGCGNTHGMGCGNTTYMGFIYTIVQGMPRSFFSFSFRGFYDCFFKSWLSFMAQKLGPHIVQYSPSVCLPSLKYSSARSGSRERWNWSRQRNS